MDQKFLIFLFILAGLICKPQERLGITNSNYSSTNSIYLNPSSSVDSRTYMQLNLVGANIFLMNNIGYLPKFSVWSLKNADQLQNPQVSDIKLKKFVYANASVEGPAFVISKEEYGAGIFVRARSVGSLNNVPYKLTNLILKNDRTGPASDEFNLRNMRFSNMTWVEYGLNFGKMIKRERNNLFTLGANLKYLTGINIIYGNVQQLKGFYNDSVLHVETLEGKLRYNDAGWSTGKGAGLDIGFTYKKMLSVVDAYYANSKKSNCTFVDYKYRIAGSLRDLGYIRFKRNTSRTNIDGSGHFNTAVTDTTYKEAIQYNFNSVVTADPIWAMMPLSLSGQFDYNFENHLYGNVTIVKNFVPNRATGVPGANLISVAARYEFRQFEVAMPLTFQRFLYPQLGFAFRVRTFVLGFDNVLPLVIKKNTYGLNVYFTLGISLFKNPACKVRSTHVDYCPPKLKTPKRERSRSEKRKRKKYLD